MQQKEKFIKQPANSDNGGYSIAQNSKKKWYKDKLSGHEWSEDILLNTFSIMGPFQVEGIDNNFKSVKKAQEKIDFYIKFGLNLPENNGC